VYFIAEKSQDGIGLRRMRVSTELFFLNYIKNRLDNTPHPQTSYPND
jgi:hypothetical protein